MKELKDKVAVITGAASGIGRALAERCALEGMKVVLADIKKEALIQTETDMKKAGSIVSGKLTDVSKAEDVEALARHTLDTFGEVHLLCNNAGVGIGRFVPLWKTTVSDWKWCIDVNLWSVIHGIRSFVPIMLSQDTEAHVLNTASVAGFLSSSLRGTYNVTKNGVVILSETLHHELKEIGSKIGVSVLCPGFVRTGIVHAEETRPEELKNDPAEEQMTPELAALTKKRIQAVLEGSSPEMTAEYALTAVKENRFYIIPHPEIKPLIQSRTDDIIYERHPVKPDYSKMMYPEKMRDKKGEICLKKIMI